MIDYTGYPCPVCGKAFTEHDDIVVCPECGAPYHRACYVKAGKCVFSDKHGTREAWTPPKPDSRKEEADRGKKCPRCGSLNHKDALFCDHCGQPLSQSAPPHPESGDSSTGNGTPPSGAPFPGGVPPTGVPGYPIPFLLDPMGGIGPNEPIDGVPAGDIAKLVQNNTQYYLPAFFNLFRFGRSRFNFSAFLFTGGWLLYRKQYKFGAILTAAVAALHLFSSYFSLNFVMPIYASLLAQAGIPAGSVLNYTQWIQISELLAERPLGQILQFSVPAVVWIVQLALAVVMGFCANRWYLKHCVRTIHRIHQQTQHPAEAETLFQERGGVNTALAVSLLICYLMITYFLP